MKRFYNHTRDNNLSYYTLILCVALIALKIHWLPPFMIALVVFWFIERKEDLSWDNVQSQKSTRLLILFILLFAWQIAGLIFADSIDSGFERIYKRASFILFPLALFLPAEKIKTSIGQILKIFTICIFIYVCYCFGNAIENSLTIKDGVLIFNPYHEIYTWESYFTGLHLSSGVHPNYLSMYVLMATIIALDSLFDPTESKRRKILWLFLSVVFLIFIILLSTRSGILSAIILVPVFLILKLYTRIRIWMIASAIVIFIFIFASLALTNSRIIYTMERFSGKDLIEALNNDIRVNIWKSAIGVAEKNLVIGVGTGNASKELKSEFKRRGYTEGLYEDLNSHNQFLEILVENGIVGLLIFVSLLFYIGYIAISDRNIILLIFLIMTIIFFAFESMLNRISGVMFFPLFSFLLIWLRPQNK